MLGYSLAATEDQTLEFHLRPMYAARIWFNDMKNQSVILTRTSSEIGPWHVPGFVQQGIGL